jgi:hypothetical protein
MDDAASWGDEAAYFEDMVKTIGSSFEELDGKIKDISIGWKIDRISRVARTILYIAVYEIDRCEDIPVKVSINEAVELAKKYDTQEAAFFYQRHFGHLCTEGSKRVMPVFLGIDTSNYMTSAALYDSDTGQAVNRRRLLPVTPGEKGIRQNEAVFLHTMQLPSLLEELTKGRKILLEAIGVSDAPRRTKGSYMPCFMVGVGVASALSSVSGVPLYRFSHQEGHIMAALYSAKRMDLLASVLLFFKYRGNDPICNMVNPDGLTG